MLGYALLVRGLINLFFSYNVAFISRKIGRGQLDHLLIQPMPLWAALVTEGFAPFSSSGMLLPAGLLLISSARQLDLQPSAAWVALFIAYLLASTAIVLAFEYAWGSLAFWVPRAAEEINSHTWDLLQVLTPFPLDGVSGVALGMLLTLVPVGLIAWLPSRALLGIDPPTWTSTLATPAAAMMLAALATWIFLRGFDHYRRTGSSRYLDYGHRR